MLEVKARVNSMTLCMISAIVFDYGYFGHELVSEVFLSLDDLPSSVHEVCLSQTQLSFFASNPL